MYKCMNLARFVDGHATRDEIWQAAEACRALSLIKPGLEMLST